MISALHAILSGHIGHTRALMHAMVFEIETGILPRIGDDSNRFLQSLLNALVAEGAVEYGDVTVGLETRALHVELSPLVDHTADMKILKCRQKHETLQESIHDVFVAGNHKVDLINIWYEMFTAFISK